ncbi:MAG: SagB/ThcOx family dehydrogenase [Candidatus Moranbacteria bacterium]|nr:SagB/ThcOx family dehydrogenase [Candidatus Moranbacteria bacterium]
MLNTIDLSKLFHQSSKDHTKGHFPIAKNSDEWPASWRTIEYKEYPRFERIFLPNKPEPRFTQAELAQVVNERYSSRSFTGGPLTLSQLSTLLRYSCGIVRSDGSDKVRRAQPSGGGRYPLEIYPIVFQGNQDVPEGVYHYNVREHALETLWQRKFSKSEVLSLFSYEWTAEASVAVIITAVFERNQRKYGERGYRYMLLEAGHVGQNIHLVSQALGLGCCALGGTHDQALETLLDIDGVTESVVHELIVGQCSA